jgi:hypothetical protein
MDPKLTTDLSLYSSVKTRKVTDISIFVDENIVKLGNKKSENTN